MLVRTISQLPLVEDNYSNGRLEISVPEGNVATSTRYTSKAIKQTTLSSGIASATQSSIASKYSLDNGSTPIDVNGMRATVNALSAQNMNTSSLNIKGIKRFNDWPFIYKTAAQFPTTGLNNYGNDAKYIIPNVDKVNDLIGNQPVYFSTSDSMVAEGLPLNAHRSSSTDKSVPESLNYETTVGSGKFYFWRIDDKDSSKSVYDTRSSTVDAYEQMRDTGQLVVWGWLADNGEVDAEMAWVGLFAAIKCEGYDTTHTYDLPISIQPWIRGEHASTMQYISFNVPVKKGLNIKIKTGFSVNTSAQGFKQGSGTLSFVDRWVPNAFFGYVVK